MYVNDEYVHALCPWCKRMGTNPESVCSDVVPPSDNTNNDA